MDQKTRIARIRDVCDSFHSAWLARPGLNDPQREKWEVKAREELIRLKDLVRHVKEQTPVPPIALAFLVEHNRAYTARERKYNYEAVKPNNSYDRGGLFYRDETYKFRLKESGWWMDIAVPEKAPPAQELDGDDSRPRRQEHSSAGRKQPTTDPSRSGDAASVREGEGATAGDDRDAGRRTRARTRAAHLSQSAVPAVVPTPSVERKVAAPAKAAPATNPSPSTHQCITCIALPLPGLAADTTWDPTSQAIVDAWLITPLKCKRCSAAGQSCRINLVHGVACNRCTKSSVGCSFVAKPPDAGPKWTYDQRRWILVQWARTATAKSSHPCDVLSNLKGDFTPPSWFLDGLQNAREHARGKDDEPSKKRAKRRRAESPPAQKCRATAPTSDMEDETPAPRAPSAPAARRHRTRARSAPSKPAIEDEDKESEESGDDSAGEVDDPAERRPIKRLRADSRASSAVPQAPRSWKNLRNVEDILRERPDGVAVPTREDHTQNTGSSTELSTAQYAPDFDWDPMESSCAQSPAAVAAGPSSRPSGSRMRPGNVGGQVVGISSKSNTFLDARLAAVWEAIAHQQAAHDALREETRRELDSIRTRLSDAIVDARTVACDRDILLRETVDKSAEISRLRVQLRALEARLAHSASSHPGWHSSTGTVGGHAQDEYIAPLAMAVAPLLVPLGASPPENSAVNDDPMDGMQQTPAYDGQCETTMYPFNSPPASPMDTTVLTEVGGSPTGPLEGVRVPSPGRLPSVHEVHPPAMCSESTDDADTSRTLERSRLQSPSAGSVDPPSIEDAVSARSDGLHALSAYASSSGSSRSTSRAASEDRDRVGHGVGNAPPAMSPAGPDEVHSGGGGMEDGELAEG